jgi:uncharacterized membrane protein
MNIHPLFVHFPIGILCTYAIIEISYWLFPIVRRQPWVQGAKIFLVTFGVLWIFPTAGTGDLAAEIIEKKSDTLKLIETHEMFASISMGIFMIIAFSYLLPIAIRNIARMPRIIARIISLIARLEPITKRISESPLVAVFSFFGLVSVIITGALGAALVYGKEADPAISFIYALFM